MARLRQLPIQRWSYRAEDPSISHVGPTAQDFYAAFGLGDDERAIGSVDADGIALAAVQALEVRTSKQAAELESLKAENKELCKRLDALDSRTGMRAAGLPLTATLIVLGLAMLVTMVRRRATT